MIVAQNDKPNGRVACIKYQKWKAFTVIPDRHYAEEASTDNFSFL